MINIVSNGSKWPGEANDSIATLIETLGRYPLDKTFEDYGNFIITDEPKICGVQVWGNFSGLSNVFDIRADSETELADLIAAVRANQTRPDYISQVKPVPQTKEEYLARRTINRPWLKDAS